MSKISFKEFMTLEIFIDNVKCCGLMNSDGFGRYITKEGKETNLEVIPSDVKNKTLRTKEFDSIIWYKK